MIRPRRFPTKYVGVLIALILLSLVGSHFGISPFLGVDFLFASIAMLVVLSLAWALKHNLQELQQRTSELESTKERLRTEISNRERAEEAFERAREAAEAANRELEGTIRQANEMTFQAEVADTTQREFLADLNHKIRTPLNGVIGMTALLLDTNLDPEQREYAEAVRTSGELLMLIINDIFDFSKIEVGKLDLEIIDFDLRVTIDDVMGVLSFGAQKRGLEFAYLIHPNVPSLLRGDPGRLRQILINLAGNAIKFTEKGKVMIHVTLEAESETHATVRVTVTDTGIGIPEDCKDRLVGSSSEGDGTTRRRFGGRGLGLAISKRLSEMMGGEIGLESEMGKGSTAWFTAVLEKQPKDRKVEIPVPGDIQGRRILVVDDKGVDRHILGEHLRSFHCRFDEALSGAEGLDKLRQALAEGDPFAVAILDMGMPEMDGESLGRKVKEDPDLKGTILVMLTAVGMRGDVARLEKIGVAAYLTKPVERSLLYDCLAAVTGEDVEAQGGRSKSVVTRHSIAEDRKRRTRVLIAEDNVTNQKVALGILERLGFRADAVPTGAEAVKALTLIPYDLILMDVQMPEMDGLEATTIIRQKEKERGGHIPIIAMTAYGIEGERERCLEAGMDDYISKPVQPERLVEAIEGLISGSTADNRQAPENAPSRETRIFDRSALLKRLGGDEQFCDELVKEFMEDVSVRLAQLKQALDDNDAAVVKHQAHTLKGASANIGAQALRDVAMEIETAGREGNFDLLGPIFRRLEDEFENLRTAVSPPGS